MGLGLLGRGVGDAKFLASSSADLVITDLKNESELKPSLAKLKKFKRLKFTLGKHRLEDFRNRDLIIKAAGVPLDSPFIAEARKNKIDIAMSTALFAKLSGAKIIGVTGTRGKTTVTKLIYEILKLGLNRSQMRTVGRTTLRSKVVLGGNIQGLSTLALLPKVKPNDLVVLELDSWQLQGFASPVGLWPRGDLGISPPIAIFTNFMPDHLNYYHGDLERYFEDKQNIYKYQKKEDIVFVGREIARKIKSPGRKIIPPALPDNWKLSLVGEHNRVNASFAVAVARELGIPNGLIKKAVANFRGVPGRLELVRTLDGVKFYNDTTSTTPDALKVGLEALGGKKPNIILIMGGADKGLDMSQVTKAIRRYCKAVILLPGTGTEKLMKLKANEAENRKEVSTLPEAMREVMKTAKHGDTVLFSPGFASFGPPPGGFKNEFDRGRQFNKLVKNLK